MRETEQLRLDDCGAVFNRALSGQRARGELYMLAHNRAGDPGLTRFCECMEKASTDTEKEVQKAVQGSGISTSGHTCKHARVRV